MGDNRAPKKGSTGPGLFTSDDQMENLEFWERVGGINLRSRSALIATD